MRLLHVIRSMRPESGGPLEGLYRMVEVFARDGHYVEVVTLESEEEVARRTFPVRVTGLGKGIGRYGYNRKLAPWLKQHAGEFDCVVVHGLWNYSSLGSWRALRNLSTPYFIFSHGMMSPWFRKHYPLKHLKKQAFWLLAEGRVLRDARYVLFTCDEERLSARKVFRGFRYKEWVPGYGTADPTGDAASQKTLFLTTFPALNNRRFFLFLGRVHPVKGCDLLIEAFAECISTLPSDFNLVIAGPDPSGMIPGLKELAERLGISDRIHWLAMLEGDLKWGTIRAADALIHPSHHENFGMVVAEAMACGTPVLISNKVNIWREVMESQGGAVEPDTVEGTRNLICRYLALSGEELAKMKAAARQGFLQYFDVEESARNLLHLISATTDERR
jgi:glycosyltransferase involved in cell wall biosynthesis